MVFANFALDTLHLLLNATHSRRVLSWHPQRRARDIRSLSRFYHWTVLFAISAEDCLSSVGLIHICFMLRNRIGATTLREERLAPSIRRLRGLLRGMITGAVLVHGVPLAAGSLPLENHC
jgi:hypothetical protein